MVCASIRDAKKRFGELTRKRYKEGAKMYSPQIVKVTKDSHASRIKRLLGLNKYNIHYILPHKRIKGIKRRK